MKEILLACNFKTILVGRIKLNLNPHRNVGSTVVKSKERLHNLPIDTIK